MTLRDEEPWRLPPSVGAGDIKMKSRAATRPLSSSAKARLRRIVNRAPEAMVKVTGRSRGGAGHLKAHLDYITRNGRVRAETQSGELVADRARLREINDEWLMSNAVEGHGKAGPNAAQSVGLILSMPPGTPPDRVEAAARSWAIETFVGKNDWLMTRHDDTDHPHVHVTVRAVGCDGRRLAPNPDDLQQWRERFARELRRLGVEAEATPRQARGIVRKNAPSAIHRGEKRGVDLHVRRSERAEARRDAILPSPPVAQQWSRAIQSRQESIRRAYLGHAEELARGDRDDRQLARDITRFVANMPVPLTRRQSMAVHLRRAMENEQRNRGGSTATDKSIGEAPDRARPEPERTPSMKPPLPEPKR